MSHMEASGYDFLGLAVDADARIALLKSRLILAKSFLVGTRFNFSRLVFASMRPL